jgi:hypothetical protein
MHGKTRIVHEMTTINMSRLQVKYEWCYETIDEHGDIIDNDFADKLADLIPPQEIHQLCLVRSEGDEIDGVQDRWWAYVEVGKLPDNFSDEMGVLTDIAVPKKLKDEFKKKYNEHPRIKARCEHESEN